MKFSRTVLWLLLLSLVTVLPGQAAEGPSSAAANTPVITGLSPKHIKAGSPGFTLRVKGRHFGRNSVVLCNGSPMPTDWESYHGLDADIPASDLVNAGKLSITVQNRGKSSNSKNLTVTDPPPAQPQPQPVKITTSSLPGGQAGTAYHATLAATGGQQPYHWLVTSGNLPGGVSLSGSGQFSGSPNASGNFPITVQVRDSSSPSALTDSKALTINIAAAPQAPLPLLITTTGLPGGQVGSAYPITLLTAVGGTQPYHWSVLSGALPGGLSLSDGGQLSGTPNVKGNFTVTFQVKDSSKPTALTDSKQWTISIAAAPPTSSPVKITTTSLPSGQVGSAYPTTSLTATGGTQPYHWSMTGGALPGGLQLSDSGQLSGTPNTQGNFPVTIQAKDSTLPNGLIDSKQWTINIAAAPPTSSPVKITTSSLPSGQVGSTYPTTSLAASGGTPPYNWSLASSSGPLPDGLTMDSSGQISGSPTKAGAFLMTIQVQDSAKPTASTDSATLSINIATNQPPSSGSGALALFFTDLLSGPNTGGEGSNGAFVAIYGKGFGTSRGSSTVTVGGGQVASYRAWGQNNAANKYLDLIVVQLGSNTKTGDIVVHTPAGDSNPLPFTVRPGNIFFVSPSGNDANPGTFASPWATPVQAKNAMQPGDIAYFRQGTWTKEEDFATIVNLTQSGNEGAPLAFIGYPGEVAFLDNANSTAAVYNWGPDLLAHWVLAEMKFRANYASLRFEGGVTDDIRVVGNDITSTDNSVSMNVEHPATRHRVYGNNMHDNGTGAQKAYSLYYGGYGAQSDIDIGWNWLHDNPLGKGLQVYGHQAGDTISNLRIHDNVVNNNAMSGMVIGGNDGGTDFIVDVTLWNNVFYNNGRGHPDWAYHGIELTSISGKGGTFYLYNNTFYNDGAPTANHSAGTEIHINIGIGKAVFTNNIFYANPASPGYYSYEYGATEAGMSASNNVYFNNGGGPGFDTHPINADPLFVDLGSFNFRLRAGSPAIDAGINTGILFDFDGVLRPQGAQYDIGAFEFKK